MGRRRLTAAALATTLATARTVRYKDQVLLLAAHLTQIVATLRDIIAAHAHTEVRRDAARAPFFVRLWNRVGRAARHVVRLHALWEQGKLPHPRPSRAGMPRALRATPHAPFPRRHGWFTALAGYPAGGSASHLRHFLQRPDMPAFLLAVPQAGRHLRPLCRMLGVDLPPILQLPPRPPRPAKPSPAAFRPGPPGTPDRPLPREVRAAARAWRRKSA